MRATCWRHRLIGSALRSDKGKDQLGSGQRNNLSGGVNADGNRLPRPIFGKISGIGDFFCELARLIASVRVRNVAESFVKELARNAAFEIFGSWRKETLFPKWFCREVFGLEPNESRTSHLRC
jgi:hypothetical protein